MNYINQCRDVEKMLIKLSIYYERLQNDEISYFLLDVPICSVGNVQVHFQRKAYEAWCHKGSVHPLCHWRGSKVNILGASCSIN